MVFSDKSEIENEYTQYLIRFHVSNDGYDCRLISKSDLDRILRDYSIQHFAVDFGIYGERYLYKGVVAKSDEIVGSYSKDANEISKFVECFETCWSSPSALRAERVMGANHSRSQIRIDDFLGLSFTHPDAREVDPPESIGTQGKDRGE